LLSLIIHPGGPQQRWQRILKALWCYSGPKFNVTWTRAFKFFQANQGWLSLSNSPLCLGAKRGRQRSLRLFLSTVILPLHGNLLTKASAGSCDFHSGDWLRAGSVMIRVLRSPSFIKSDTATILTTLRPQSRREQDCGFSITSQVDRAMSVVENILGL